MFKNIIYTLCFLSLGIINTSYGDDSGTKYIEHSMGLSYLSRYGKGISVGVEFDPGKVSTDIRHNLMERLVTVEECKKSVIDVLENSGASDIQSRSLMNNGNITNAVLMNSPDVTIQIDCGNDFREELDMRSMGNDLSLDTQKEIVEKMLHLLDGLVDNKVVSSDPVKKE